MTDDFDIAQAERILVSAQAATTPGVGHGSERIRMFPVVTDWLNKSVAEVKRLRASRASLISEALSELNGLMTAQLEDALRRHGDLLAAVRDFRERNYYLKRADDGKYRWTPKANSDIHDAIERLAKATLAAERSGQ